MSKSYVEESIAPLPSDSRPVSNVFQNDTGNSASSTNPFRRSLAEKEQQSKQGHGSVQLTGSGTASHRTSLSKPPGYRSQRVSGDFRKEAFDEISVPDRRSLDSYRHAPSTVPSSSAPVGRHRRSSSLRERYPGDPSVRPLDQLSHENKLAQRSPHLRKKHQPRPDVIDVLDDTGLNYHHEGPYDAALLVRNSSYNSSPVAALDRTNREALKATPHDKIRDSLNDHRPLDGTAMVPPGQRDAFGRVYNYEEGSDMQREYGGDYKRWPGIKYLPEDLKGKGEPSFSLERAIKEHEQATQRYSADGNEFELVERPRPSSADATGRDAGSGAVHQRGHSRTKNISGEFKKRFGSLRRKDK